MAGLTTADNGLSVNPAGNVQLGGPLIMTTQIDLNAFTLEISGTQADTSFLTNFINSAAFSQFQTVAQVRGTTDAAQLTVQAGNVVGSAVIDFHLLNAANLQTGIRIDESIPGIQIEDNISLLGLQYRSDYSVLGLTDPRWIPDLGAVQGLSFYLADGTLNSDRFVDFGTHGLFFTDSLNSNMFFVMEQSTPTNPTINLRSQSAGTGKAALDMDAGTLRLQILDAALTNDMGFSMRPTGWELTDNINLKGMVYVADYTAAQLADPRAITDVGGVEQLIGRSLNVVPGVTTSTLLQTVAVPGAGSGYLYRVSANIGITAGTGTMHGIYGWTDVHGNASTRTTSTVGPTPGTDTATVFSMVVGAGTNLTISSVAVGTITADFYIEVELIGKF
jgi:hypothetical protein